MEQETLATELLHMVKMSAKRWFIIAMVELGIILAMIIGFIIYTYIPTDEYYYEQTMEDVDGDNATQMVGGNYNGENETDSESQAQK